MLKAIRSEMLGVIAIVLSLAGVSQVEGQIGFSLMPSINVNSAGGMAPFTVHVHALNSDLGAGTPITARYQWSFGDPSGSYNQLTGWNAAHTYMNPGTYTISLTITNEAREVSTVTTNVTITADTRSPIYVAANGNDGSTGASSSSPVRTISRVAQLLGSSPNNRKVLFRRGDQFDTSGGLTVTGTNVYFTSYGSGALPVLNWTGSSVTFNAILACNSATARDVIFEGLAFDSSYAASPAVARGVSTAGQNITVRNCTFRDLSFAMTAEHDAFGLLTQGNTCQVLGAYYLWGEGADHVHLGNTFQDSMSEHTVRMAGVQRSLFAYNDFRNTLKSNIWCMLGSYAYIANNTIREGPVGVGPHQTQGSPNEKFTWAVIEANIVINDQLNAEHGAENVIFRNNVITHSGGSCFRLDCVGGPEFPNRTIRNVRILNNTGINNSVMGQFITINKNPPPNELVLANNFYRAPNLQTGASQTGNVLSYTSNLNGMLFRRNMWCNPAVVGWGNGWHYVWNYWSHIDGYRNTSEWNSLPQTSSDGYENVALSPTYAPPVGSVTANHARPEFGVITDMYGAVRPPTGTWTAGAVQVGLPQGPNPGDLNGDGIVNAQDLSILLGAWGQWGSAADLNGDGIVNAADLAILLGNWG